MGWLAVPSLSLSYLLFLQAECDCTRLWLVTAASSPSQVNFTGNSASLNTFAMLGYSQGRVVCRPGVLPATPTTLYLLIYDVCGLHHSAHERRQRTTCRTWLFPPTTWVLSVKHRQLGVSSRQLYALSHCTHSCTWEHFLHFIWTYKTDFIASAATLIFTTLKEQQQQQRKPLLNQCEEQQVLPLVYDCPAVWCWVTQAT